MGWTRLPCLGSGIQSRALGSLLLGRANWVAKLQTQSPRVGRIKCDLGSWRNRRRARPGTFPKELTTQPGFRHWKCLAQVHTGPYIWTRHWRRTPLGWGAGWTLQTEGRALDMLYGNQT